MIGLCPCERVKQLEMLKGVNRTSRILLLILIYISSIGVEYVCYITHSLNQLLSTNVIVRHHVYQPLSAHPTIHNHY